MGAWGAKRGTIRSCSEVCFKTKVQNPLFSQRKVPDTQPSSNWYRINGGNAKNKARQRTLDLLQN